MPRIFISYRRDDSMDQASEIARVLTQRFGADHIFFDHDTLVYGEDYFRRIIIEIEASAAQIVVIGPQWLTLINPSDNLPRIAHKDDVVAIEIKTALKKGIPIIPIYLNQTPFFREVDLPRQIQKLALRQGKQVDTAHITDELQDIIQTVLIPLIDPDGFVTREFELGICITGPLCHIPGGTFQMGSNTGNEKDMSSVTLADFAIGRYPVTVQEYARFVEVAKHPAPPNFGGLFWSDQLRHPKHPVVNVSWQDAVVYAAWLATLTGQGWRLLTEAEWEYAACWDAGAKTPHGRTYPWGDAWDAKKANTADGGTGHLTHVTAHPTGRSSFGVQDMVGNAWEWTSSLNAPYPYTLATHEDATKTHTHRIHRGGSWKDPHTVATTTRRTADAPNVCNPTLGFRLALG